MGELDGPQSAMLLTEDEWEAMVVICRRYITSCPPESIDPDCVVLAMRVIEGGMTVAGPPCDG